MPNSIQPAGAGCTEDFRIGSTVQGSLDPWAAARSILNPFFPSSLSTTTVDGPYWNGNVVSSTPNKVQQRGLPSSRSILFALPKRRLMILQRREKILKSIKKYFVFKNSNHEEKELLIQYFCGLS